MNDNASHIAIHHYHHETSESLKLLTMVCCIVLIIVVVFILFLIMAGIMYLIIQKSKKNPVRDHPDFRHSLQSPIRNAVSNPYEDGRSIQANEHQESDINANVQNIPMSTIRNGLHSRLDNSDSSAGLADILFPKTHQGEILTDRLVPKNIRQKAPSGSARSGRTVEDPSLDWDYFQAGRRGTSNVSEASKWSDCRKAVDVCWV